MKNRTSTKAYSKEERLNKIDDLRKQTKITLYFKISGVSSKISDKSQNKIIIKKIKSTFPNLKKKLNLKDDKSQNNIREDEDIKILFEKIISKNIHKSNIKITNDSLNFSNQSLENKNKLLNKNEIKVDEGYKSKKNIIFNNFQKKDGLRIPSDKVKLDVDSEDTIININYITTISID